MGLRIDIINDGSHYHRPEFGNYHYKVFVNQDVIASGRLQNHRRVDGWQALIRQLLEEEEDG